MASEKNTLRSRLGPQIPVGADVVEGYFDYSGATAETATETPTGGSFQTDNFGVELQATTQCYVSFNGTTATANSFRLFAHETQRFDFAVTEISVLRVADDGTLKWHCIVGED